MGVGREVHSQSFEKESKMAKREEYEKRTEALLQPIIDELSLELVDVEYVKEGSDYYLRAYIDKEGGVNIGDCEAVSRRLSDLLDAEDFIADAYILEVSSPGLGRQLKKDKDFVRENGKEVELKLYKAVDKSKEFTGILSGFDEKTVKITIDGEEKSFERENIAKISLTIDF